MSFARRLYLWAAIVGLAIIAMLAASAPARAAQPARMEQREIAKDVYVMHDAAESEISALALDKQGVTDPHDNAALAIDGQGYIWVFVSGRATAAPAGLVCLNEAALGNPVA